MNYLDGGGFPFGKCGVCKERAAVHQYSDGKRCAECMPAEVVFAPFLGFQSDLVARTERYVLAGAGAGPGKTFVGSRLWIKQWVDEDRRWRAGEIEASVGWAIYMRRHMPELEQVIAGFKKYYLKLDPEAEWHEQKKICTFSCGYKVQFAGCEHEDDYLKYYSNEYTLFVVDEAIQYTENMLEELDTRVRCVDPVLGAKIQTVLLTNPIGGNTRDYLRRRYVRVAPPRTTVKIRVKLKSGAVLEETQIYLPGNLHDNPVLMADGRYEANLLQKKTETRRALLDNDWDVQEGTWVGDDWDRDIHVCEPFAIPTGWYKFKSGDYGFSAPSSIQWFAVDTEGNMVCYRSLTVTGHTAEELGWRIKEIESQVLYHGKGKDRVVITGKDWDETNDHSKVYGPMDSSLWARVGETGPSRGEILENIGCGFTRSDKNPDSAAEQVRNRLRKRTPDATGNMTIPGIRWFSTCATTNRLKNGEFVEIGPITTIPALLADSAYPDRWDTTGNDHDADSVGYACLHRMLAPPTNTEEGNRAFFDELRARRRMRTARRSVSGFPGLY